MSSVAVVFSIEMDVVRFISLTILVPLGNTGVSHQSTESYKDIGKVINITTTGERSVEILGKLPL